MALVGCLFVFGVFRMLVAKRKEFLFSVVYALGAFFIFGIGMIMIETGERVHALVLMGLYIAPILLEIPIVLLYWLMRLRAVLGGERDLHRGVIHLIEGRHEGAVAPLARYQQQHPQDPAGWGGLASSLVGVHRYEEALENVDRALELKRTPEGLLFRGRILLILGASEEALADIEAALASKPHLRLAETLLALALIKLRRLDGALAALKRERFWRKNSQYFWALGDVHRLCRRGALASKAYEEAAIRAVPEVEFGLVYTKSTMACILARQGKLEQAEEVVRSLLSKDASDIEALSAQALIQRQRGDCDGVEATLQRMLALNPNDVVGTLADPDLTPLFAEERFRRLLCRALEERERILERVRSRPHPPQVNDPSGRS
ncbi:MAG: tetratricopeptide repeat protein [Dehalococcoidia bacterium]|nr:tetratricopeptide repeat protein [Dehalococcoidia bacterium]